MVTFGKKKNNILEIVVKRKLDVYGRSPKPTLELNQIYGIFTLFNADDNVGKRSKKRPCPVHYYNIISSIQYNQTTNSILYSVISPPYSLISCLQMANKRCATSAFWQFNFFFFVKTKN